MNTKIPEYIFCHGGGKPLFKIAVLEYGLYYGIQIPDSDHGYPLRFTDQNWKNPNRELYMRKVKEKNPYKATVLDLEREDQYDEVISWAEEIADHVQNEIIIIPKVNGIIPRIPEKIKGKDVILGYSVPTKYAGTEVPVEEFFGRKVHLLGGSPKKQEEFRDIEGWDVVSIDANYISKTSMFNSILRADDKYSSLNKVYENVGRGSIYITFELNVINYIFRMTRGEKAREKKIGFIRFAKEEDIDSIKGIANKYKKELGFLNKTALLERIKVNQCYVVEIGGKTEGKEIIKGEIIGFCMFYKRKDGWKVIYDIAVLPEYKGMGIAKGMIAAMGRNVRCECVKSNDANVFYEKIGFTCIGEEEGRKNPLLVWSRENWQ